MNSLNTLHQFCLTELNPDKRVTCAIQLFPTLFRNFRTSLENALQEGQPGLGFEIPGAGYVEVSEVDDLHDVLVRLAANTEKFLKAMRYLFRYAEPASTGSSLPEPNNVLDYASA